MSSKEEKFGDAAVSFLARNVGCILGDHIEGSAKEQMKEYALAVRAAAQTLGIDETMLAEIMNRIWADIYRQTLGVESGVGRPD